MDVTRMARRYGLAAVGAAVLLILAAGVTAVAQVDVTVDLKPGSDTNTINPDSRGLIPVAILTTDDFDATTVDPLSVVFGPLEATESHGCGHLQDVDGDGDVDLLLHFATLETGIQPGDTVVRLVGSTYDGQAIAAVTSVRTTPPADKDTIAIGAVLSLSGSGSSIGEPERTALRLLEEEINQAGLLDRPISVVIEDDQTDPAEAVAAVGRLLDEHKVVAVLGPSTSASTMAVKPIMLEAGMPLLAMGSASSITEPPMDWVWQIPANDSLAVAKALGYISGSLALTRVATLYDDNAFGSSGAALIEERAPDFGLEVVAQASYSFDETDLTAQLTMLWGADPEVIVVWGTNPGPAVAAKNMRDLGMPQPYVGSHGIANAKFVELAGDAAEGVVVPAAGLLVPDAVTDPDRRAVIDEFVADIIEATGEAPTTFAGHGFSALTLLADAITRAGSIDAAAIQTALNQTAGVTTPDGIYNYTPTDHVGLTPDDLYMVMVEGGAWVPAP